MRLGAPLPPPPPPVLLGEKFTSELPDITPLIVRVPAFPLADVLISPPIDTMKLLEPVVLIVDCVTSVLLKGRFPLLRTIFVSIVPPKELLWLLSITPCGVATQICPVPLMTPLLK